MRATYCLEAIQLIKEKHTQCINLYASRIQVICEFLREREIKLANAHHEANFDSH
jgi:hypothetical protein